MSKKLQSRWVGPRKSDNPQAISGTTLRFQDCLASPLLYTRIVHNVRNPRHCALVLQRCEVQMQTTQTTCIRDFCSIRYWQPQPKNILADLTAKKLWGIRAAMGYQATKERNSRTFYLVIISATTVFGNVLVALTASGCLSQLLSLSLSCSGLPSHLSFVFFLCPLAFLSLSLDLVCLWRFLSLAVLVFLPSCPGAKPYLASLKRCAGIPDV